MNRIPQLLRVTNRDTREVFTIFAKSTDEAYLTLPIAKSDDLEFTWMHAPANDGSGEQWPIYMLKYIPNDSYFRTVNCNTLNVSKTTYFKPNSSYDRSTKKYSCWKFEDVNCDRAFKSTHWVVTDFTF